MAANPAMLVRIAANLEELKRNLAEGKSQIETTTAAMGKLASSFSGDKIIQAAHNVTAAVNQIGGASKLTEAEQARVNATVTKALEKYQALGREAPPALIDLGKATTQAGAATAGAAKQTETWSGQLKGLAATLGVTFSIGAIVSFGKELLRMGDEIVRVADRTGLTTTEVQQLQYVVSQTGNTIEELTSSIGQMQNRLASGDSSAVAAVRALGLNFEQLRAAGPNQQLEMIAAAVGKVPDPARQAQLAMDLFGRTGIAILPTLKANVEALGKAAPKMSEDTVRALDDAGDALARVGLQAKVWAAEAYNFLRFGFELAIMGAYKAAAAFLSMMASIGEVLAKVPGANTAMKLFGQDIGKVREQAQWYTDAANLMAQEQTKVATATAPAAVQVQTMADRVKAALTPALEKLSTEQKAYIAQMHEAGVNTSEMATAVGVSETAVGKYVKGLEEHGKKNEEAAKAAETFRAGIRSVVDVSNTYVGLAPAVASRTQEIANIMRGLTEDSLIPTARSFANLSGQINLADIEGGRIKQTFVAAESTTKTWETSLGELSKAFSQLAQTSGGAFGTVAQWLGTVTNAMNVGVKAGKGLETNWKDLKAGGAGAATAAVGFATNIMGMIGAMDAATSGGSKLQNTIGGLMTGMQMGAQVAGVWGAVIGAAIGGLIGLFRGGVSPAVQQARQDIEKFQQTLAATLTSTQKLEAGNEQWRQTTVAVRDAYLATGRTAAEADAIIRQLWNDKDPAGVAAAIQQVNAVMAEAKQRAADLKAEQDALNAAVTKYAITWKEMPAVMQAARSQELLAGLKADIDSLVKGGFEWDAALRLVASRLTDVQKEMLGLTSETTVDFKAMQDAAKKYGIDLASLGPQFQSARLHDAAKTIYDDFVLLTRGGADVGGVLYGMRNEISKLVQDSLKFGVAIPENMRPLIEELLRSGNLIDANGNKLTDLAGLNFATPIADKLTTVIDRLTALLQATGLLPPALTDVATQAGDAFANVGSDGAAMWERWAARGGVAGRTAVAGIESAFANQQFGANVNFVTSDKGFRIGDATWYIEQFAKGGLVDRPTLGLVGEGGEPELVGPVQFMAEALRGAIAGLTPQAALTLPPWMLTPSAPAAATPALFDFAGGRAMPAAAPTVVVNAPGASNAGVEARLDRIERALLEFPRAVKVAVSDGDALRSRGR